jgi:protein-tyrosine phosphatase
MAKRNLIVPVCGGNIARSAAAEALIKQELDKGGLSDMYEVISRGTQGTRVDKTPVKHPNITLYSSLFHALEPVLRKLGIDLSSHVSTPIDEDVAARASVMLAMDRKTYQGLLALFPDQADKIHMFSELVDEERDIRDPIGVKGIKKQEQIFTDIRDIIIRGFPKLLAFADEMNETTREMTGNQPEGTSFGRPERI